MSRLYFKKGLVNITYVHGHGPWLCKDQMNRVPGMALVNGESQVSAARFTGFRNKQTLILHILPAYHNVSLLWSIHTFHFHVSQSIKLIFKLMLKEFIFHDV